MSLSALDFPFLMVSQKLRAAQGETDKKTKAKGLSYPSPYLSCHFRGSSILYCSFSVSPSRAGCLWVSGGTLGIISTLIAVHIMSRSAILMVSFTLSLSVSLSLCLWAPLLLYHMELLPAPACREISKPTTTTIVLTDVCKLTHIKSKL